MDIRWILFDNILSFLHVAFVILQLCNCMTLVRVPDENNNADECARIHRDVLSELHWFAEFGKRSAGLFHDFVNPLTALSLTIEHLALCTESVADPVIQTSLQQAMTVTRHMENHLVVIKKHMQGKSVEIQFSLAQELATICTIMSHHARRSQVGITWYCCPLGITLHGNPHKFHQVICNLVANAIDSYDGVSTEKNRRICISVKEQYGKICITVRDQGCGMSQYVQQNLFTPFITTKSSGTGLGLITVKDIVDTHFKGSIQVKSCTSSGTSFVIIVPKKYS